MWITPQTWTCYLEIQSTTCNGNDRLPSYDGTGLHIEIGMTETREVSNLEVFGLGFGLTQEDHMDFFVRYKAHNRHYGWIRSFDGTGAFRMALQTNSLSATRPHHSFSGIHRKSPASVMTICGIMILYLMFPAMISHPRGAFARAEILSPARFGLDSIHRPAQLVMAMRRHCHSAKFANGPVAPREIRSRKNQLSGDTWTNINGLTAAPFRAAGQ